MAKIGAEQAGGPDVVAFLDTLAWSEGTSTSLGTKNDGYDVIVSGLGDSAFGEQFTDYATHPFVHRAPKMIVAPGVRFPKGLRSDAAGRYQFMLATWTALAAGLHLSDFSPLSQDLAGIATIKQRGVLENLTSGRIEQAFLAHAAIPADLEIVIQRNANIWASLPGNSYGQGEHTLDALVKKFQQLLDTQAAVTA